MLDRADLRGDERAGTADAQRRPPGGSDRGALHVQDRHHRYPWRIREASGNIAGNRYTLAAKGISCSVTRTWVTKFTYQKDIAQIKGPSGFTCRSFSTVASGDKLLYSGVRMHAPHNIPFFEWAPKMPRS
jgi:hypothetical protein